MLTAASSQACVGLVVPSCLTSNWPIPWPVPIAASGAPLSSFVYLLIALFNHMCGIRWHWPVISLRQACQVSLIGPLSAVSNQQRTVGYCLNSLWLWIPCVKTQIAILSPTMTALILLPVRNHLFHHLFLFFCFPSDCCTIFPMQYSSVECASIGPLWYHSLRMFGNHTWALMWQTILGFTLD